MFGLNTISLSIIGALLITTLGMGWYIDSLQDENRELSLSIEKQNTEVEALGTEYAERVKEFHDKKPKIVTRYIKTYITKDINVSRSSCEDVNDILDNIRFIGL